MSWLQNFSISKWCEWYAAAVRSVKFCHLFAKHKQATYDGKRPRELLLAQNIIPFLPSKILVAFPLFHHPCRPNVNILNQANLANGPLCGVESAKFRNQPLRCIQSIHSFFIDLQIKLRIRPFYESSIYHLTVISKNDFLGIDLLIVRSSVRRLLLGEIVSTWT